MKFVRIIALILSFVGLTLSTTKVRATDGTGSSSPSESHFDLTADKAQDGNLASVPQLQKTIALHLARVSLEDLLRQVSAGRGVTLQVKDHSIRYQRITIGTMPMKLSDLMANIITVLSHGEISSDHPQYYWQHISVSSADKIPIYELRVTYRANLSLQRELDRPRTEALKYLKAVRDGYSLPPQKLLQHAHIMPDDLIKRETDTTVSLAVSGMSNDDLARLLAGQHLFVQSEKMDAARENAYDESITNARARGDTRDFPPYVPSLDPVYTIAISDSFFLDQPSHNQTFMINVIPGKFTRYVSGGIHIAFANYETYYGIGLLPEETGPKTPVYDIKPFLSDTNGSSDKRVDVGFNLTAIASAAHINVIAERFLRPPLSAAGMHKTKGTLSALINDLCNTWNLRVTKTGNTYLFWDRDWGRMRQADIADMELSGIHKLIESCGGTLPELDRIALFARFSYLQVALTLSPAIPEFGKPGIYRDYLSTRIVALMTPDERTLALQPTGIAIVHLSGPVQTALKDELDYTRFLAQYFPDRADSFSDDMLSHASVRLRHDESRNHELEFRANSLKIVNDKGEYLWYVSIAH